MRDQDGAAAQALHEGLELGQAVEVQVVGGFVQEHDVEPAQQQCGECHSGGLAAGEPGHSGIRPHLEAKVRQDGRDAVFQIGGAGGHPAVEGQGVGVVGAGSTGAQRLCGGLHLQGRLRAACTPGDVTADRFAGNPFVFLRQPAHKGVGGGQAHSAFLRIVDAGQQAQQGGFAGPIGPDDADDVTGRYGQGQL